MNRTHFISHSRTLFSHTNHRVWRSILLLLSIVILGACKVNPQTSEGGQIEVQGDTYFARPDAGYNFVQWEGWRNCRTQHECQIDLPEFFAFIPVEIPLTAQFARKSFFEDDGPAPDHVANKDRQRASYEESDERNNDREQSFGPRDFFEVEAYYDHEEDEVASIDQEDNNDTSAVDLRQAVEDLRRIQSSQGY